MARTWEVAHYALPHHPCPVGAGWWRGPQPQSPECERELRARGLRCGGRLPDGAARYRWDEAGFDSRAPAEPELQDPAGRAAWIAARLAAAHAAWDAEPPAPVFMAILNLAPDSFSDGGEIDGPAAAGRAAAQRAAEGAGWLDLGAESTRPGAQPVAAAVQLERLLPALEAVLPAGVPVSIDTRSAGVAAACLDAGASMVNDVSALSDPEMAPLLAERGCPVVLMHMRGTPAGMQAQARYQHLVGEVADELAARVAPALRAGVRPEQIITDPGLGFAKTAAQTSALVAGLGAFRALGFPILAGPSRKSFMAAALEDRPAAERDGGTAGAAALCAAQGAAILRLHRGGAAWDAARVARACAAAKRRGRIRGPAGRLEAAQQAPAGSTLAP